MALAAEVSAIEGLYHSFKSLDPQKLFRPELGALSLSARLQPIYANLLSRLELAVQVAPDIPDNLVSNLRGPLQGIYDSLVRQSSLADTAYANESASLFQSINSNTASMLQWWPPFVTTALEKKGLLQSESTFQKSIQDAADNAAKLVEEARKYAQELEERAKKIEAQARSTAAGVSFEVVQNEFRAAQGNLFKKVLLWGGLSAVAFAGFIVFAWYIVVHPPLLVALASASEPAASGSQGSTINSDLGSHANWVAVYLAIIRITILTAIGAATAFMLRMFRAHLHMNEYNLHRQRVVNSLPVLVQAAETPEQRDQILGRLVDLVAGFGNSGILQNEDDSFSAPKMTIDAVMKNLSGGK